MGISHPRSQDHDAQDPSAVLHGHLTPPRHCMASPLASLSAPCRATGSHPSSVRAHAGWTAGTNRSGHWRPIKDSGLEEVRPRTQQNHNPWTD